MSLRRNRAAGALLASTVALVFCASAAATTLQASHQFPGGKGDARDEMMQIIAREVKAANVDLDIEVHPNASLFKPNDQWQAMVDGKLDYMDRILDTAPYVWYGAYMDSCLTRLSTEALVNVTAGGGTTVPTFLVDKR